MADTLLSKVIGEELSYPKLAPDTNFPTNKSRHDTVTTASAGVTAGVKSTLLSLTGKYDISHLSVYNTVAESIVFKLTIDDVVIWDSAGYGSIDEVFIGSHGTSSTYASSEHFIIEESMLFEATTTTDTSISFRYLARPIL